ncbi:ATG8-interacting protein 2-like [Silene latifolia]|uniref:ATG8-interacting protein 2-like n=1 Tax=Silene latifolia TaxID=37657 RepID=UPI003D77560E
MADNEGEEAISHANEGEVPKTAENEEGARGNDWEVVSLTASAYAAAPGPKGDESIHEDNGSAVTGNEEPETSRTLFMSGHFVFPPSQHENLPIVPEKIEHPTGDQPDDLVSEMNVLKEGKFEEKENEKWGIEGLDVSKEFPDIPLFEEKSHVNEQTSPHGPNVDDKEEDFYEAVIGGSVAYDGSAVVNDLAEASNDVRDPSYPISQVPESGKEDETDDSELPCEAWWKRGVASLCAQAKETSGFWSIFVAAAVMGLVVLGQRWQQERWQVLHQRWQLSVGDEKSGRILSRLKDVIIGGSRRGTYVTAASAEH